MRRILCAAVLLLLLTPGDALKNRAQVTGRSHHDRAGQGTIRGSPRTPLLINTRETKQANSSNLDLVTVKRMKVVTFDIDDPEVENELIDSGNYNPQNIEPYYVIADTTCRNRLFVTMPVVRKGVPVSLGTIQYDGPPDAKVKPYPTLEVHHTTVDTITDCKNQLVSITPIAKSAMNEDILFALDTGVLNITTNPYHVCSPKIVAFDLLTDEVINTTVIDNAACNSLYVVMLMDTGPDGSLAAYSSDSYGFRLTVTNLTSGVSKHLQSQYFYPTSGFFFTKAGGTSAYMPFGLVGIATDSSYNGELYFQAFAGNIQNVVKKQVIREASDGDVLDTKTQLALPGKLAGTSGPLLMDASGQLLFFPVQDEMAIYCWNTSKPHDPKNFHVIAKDYLRMRYISSMQLEPTTGWLWIITNRFTSFLTDTIDYNEDNFFIMYIDVSQITC